MLGFSRLEKEAIIREFLGPEGSRQSPRCPHCGEVFNFQVECEATGFRRIIVTCPDCANGFSWQPSPQTSQWKPLHLQYFLERFRNNELLRCPLDDCCVTSTEFPEGVIEFRCPFCNRRGRARVSEASQSS